MVEDRPQGQLGSKPIPDAGHELRCEQRMPAEEKEVVLRAERLNL